MINQCPNVKMNKLIEETINNISNNFDIVLEECQKLCDNSKILDLKRTYTWQNKQPEEGWVYSWNESPDWLNYGLVSNYKYIDVNKDTCPETMKLLENLYNNKLIKVAGFSRMLPGCNLKTHKHSNPEKVTWHLGLIIPDPEKCVLTVDNLPYSQVPKQWIRFNDNLNHSSINFTDKERVILYLKLREF